jgi:predicted O-methyltransferase YrrM
MAVDKHPHAAAIVAQLREHFPVGQPLRVAELGVLGGAVSHRLLQRVPECHLVLVDPWKPYKTTEYTAMDLRFSEARWAQVKRRCLQGLQAFAPSRYTILAMTSDEAARQITELLDLVFIDGLHTRKQVAQDIINWYPLLRLGGILGGHDITTPGVLAAVEAAGIPFQCGEAKTWWFPPKTGAGPWEN